MVKVGNSRVCVNIVLIDTLIVVLPVHVLFIVFINILYLLALQFLLKDGRQVSGYLILYDAWC